MNLEEVAPADLARPDVEAFCRAMWPGEPHQGSAAWRARLASNPLRRSGEPAALAFRDAGAIVAWVSLSPVDVDAPGGPFRAAWVEDLAALPSHRGRGLGLWLVEAARERFGNLVAAGLTPDARRLFERLRWRLLGRFRRFFALSLGPAPRGTWRHAEAGAAAAIWTRAGAVGARRDAAALRRRFGDGRYRSGLLDDAAVVYWRPRPLRGLPVARVLDAFALDDEARDETLRHVRRAARDSFLPLVEMHVCDEGWAAALERAGWLERRTEAVAMGVGPDLPAGAAWHVVEADTDLER